MTTLNPALARVLKRLHYPLDVILTCVRWYVAYPLSLRHLEEMMAERGISVDHSTVHRWAIKVLPVLEKAFRRHKKAVGRSWRMDETYIKVRGQWKYLYRAVDKEGNTVDFLLRAHRDKTAARRYFEKSIEQNGEPETVTIDKSGANLAALDALNEERQTPIKISPEQVSEQCCRARSSGDQATHAAYAWFQEFSLRPDPVERHRAHAYDRQGPNARPWPRIHSCRAVLLTGSISSPT
jgi:transposase-like protein